MNSTLPIFCGTMLSAMVAAGLSHYWSVSNLVTLVPKANHAVVIQTAIPSFLKPQPRVAERTIESPVRDHVTSLTNPKSVSQEQFFNELLAELKHLKSENQDLRELMGETNRDVMKLAFRVDTTSESFRPLPTAEQRKQTSFNLMDSQPGVLPPRATPVYENGE